jgi:hypothetical protein
VLHGVADSGSLFVQLSGGLHDRERTVLNYLSTVPAGTGPVLLPFEDADAVGLDAALDVIRVALAHRDIVSGRPLIATLRCSFELLDDPARALPLLAACGSLRVNGWRLWVIGLQQDCGTPVIRRTREAALALAASGTPVWVRTSGLSRWAMAVAGLPRSHAASSRVASDLVRPLPLGAPSARFTSETSLVRHEPHASNKKCA